MTDIYSNAVNDRSKSTVTEQTAKEFLDEYVATVKERDELLETTRFQREKLVENNDDLYKYFEDTITRLLWDADKIGLSQVQVERLAQVAHNTVVRIYREDDDE